MRVKVTACESAARLEHDADVHVVISPSAALGDRVIWIRLTPKLAYLLSSREDTSEEILDELGLMEALREWVRGAVSEGLIAPPAGSHRWLKRTIGALIELGGEASAARLREHVGVSEQALRSILAALGQMKLVEARGGRVRLKSSPALQRLYKLMLEKKTSTSRELRREFIATSSKTLQWHMDILRRLGLVDSTRVGNIARYSVRDCSYYEEWSRRIASKAELLSESELRELEEAASMAREAFKRSDAVEAGLMLRKASEALSELEEKAEGRSSALSLASELAKRVEGLKRELSSEPELLKLVEGAEASRKLADVLSQPPWRVSLEGVREVEQELAELERRAREALRALAAVRSFRLIPKAVGSLLSRGEAEEVEREAAEAVADILRGVPSEKVMERLYGSKGYRVFEELVATKLGELLGRVSDIENSLQLLAADHRLRALAKLSAVKRGVRELSEASLEDTTPEELLAEIKEVERELKELEEAVAEEVLSVVSRAVRGREVSRRELAEKLGAGEKTALAALSLLERAQLAEVVVRIKRV
ncbi:MAG: hypothetical protein DRN99_06415 [Thermoproteota archaeon]|nr:MAG: hypothetical protein DRN99_06415 [Candidatus Korarchaeota archaeon]